MVDLRTYWVSKWKCRVDSWIYELGAQLWACGVGVSSLDDIYRTYKELCKNLEKQDQKSDRKMGKGRGSSLKKRHQKFLKPIKRCPTSLKIEFKLKLH